MRITTAVIIAPLLFLSAICVSQGEERIPDENLVDAEIVTVGVDHITGSPIVLLRDEEEGRAVPIWIGFFEAQAILQGIHGIETPRPLTHELTVDLLEAVGATIEEVVVYDMRGGTYYGRIYLRVADRDELIAVDSRPSDGLALAARTGARIRVAVKLLEEPPEFDFVPPSDVDQAVQVLGLTVVAQSDALREEFGLPEREGLVVSGVQEAAARRGFQRGDLIIKVNNIVPATPMEFLDEVMRTRPGREAEVHFLRDGEEKQINIPTAPDRSRSVPI